MAISTIMLEIQSPTGMSENLATSEMLVQTLQALLLDIGESEGSIGRIERARTVAALSS